MHYINFNDYADWLKVEMATCARQHDRPPPVLYADNLQVLICLQEEMQLVDLR